MFSNIGNCQQVPLFETKLLGESVPVFFPGRSAELLTSLHVQLLPPTQAKRMVMISEG